jgi:hypothetical protein
MEAATASTAAAPSIPIQSRARVYPAEGGYLAAMGLHIAKGFVTAPPQNPHATLKDVWRLADEWAAGRH